KMEWRWRGQVGGTKLGYITFDVFIDGESIFGKRQRFPPSVGGPRSWDEAILQKGRWVEDFLEDGRYELGAPLYIAMERWECSGKNSIKIKVEADVRELKPPRFGPHTVFYENILDSAPPREVDLKVVNPFSGETAPLSHGHHESSSANEAVTVFARRLEAGGIVKFPPFKCVYAVKDVKLSDTHGSAAVVPPIEKTCPQVDTTVLNIPIAFLGGGEACSPVGHHSPHAALSSLNQVDAAVEGSVRVIEHEFKGGKIKVGGQNWKVPVLKGGGQCFPDDFAIADIDGPEICLEPDRSTREPAPTPSPSPAPTSALVLPPSGRTGALKISKPQQPDNNVAPLGALRIPVTKFTLAAGDRDVTVQSVTVRKTGAAANTSIAAVRILSGDGVMLASSVLASEGTAVFKGPFTVRAGSTADYIISLDRPKSANDDGATVGFEVTALEADSAVEGDLPLAGARITMNTGLKFGSVTITRGPSDPAASLPRDIGASGLKFAALRLEGGSVEDALLKSISWHQAGSAARSDLANVKVYTGSDVYPAVASSDGKRYTATFPSGVLIQRGASLEVAIGGDIAAGGGRTVDFDLEKFSDIVLVGKQYGYGILAAGGVPGRADEGKISSDGSPSYNGYAVTIREAISPTPSPAVILTPSPSPETALGFWEFLDINDDWKKVSALPFGHRVHLVAASNGSPDVRTLLPVKIELKVNGSLVWQTTIQGDPALTCRDATGCSIDGPVIQSSWQGSKIELTARGKDGKLLASYAQ
ncbi:MAG: hypothetical protein HYT40_02035, partial [Candidatus Sungbacteria bacterium]|nr:hypothetical protein [Candidatus Sungbacteria bacterium]